MVDVHRDERLAAIATVFACDAMVAMALDTLMEPLAFAPKTLIAHQGYRSNHVWLVLDGTVHIQMLGADGQRIQLSYHGPGEFFGAYPEASLHRADIVAHGEVQLLRIATTALVALAREHAPVGAGLASRFARQLDMALDRMAARSTLTAAGRVYAEIVRLFDGQDSLTPAPQVTALALNANTTRETASRAVSALERRGVIRRVGNSMMVVAPRMLAEMIA